jgi:pimeloyl-ACP methyl ester carboxylesterase
MAVATADHMLTIAGLSLEVRFIGPPPDAAPTIVMLHEGLGSISTWGEFPQRLAERTGFGVFVYSRAGYGRSSPARLPRPLDYMQREALDVLPPLLETIGFKRGILLGHSDGASIAAIYAGSVQDHRVRAIALFAPHFFVEEQNLVAIEKARDAYAAEGLKQRLERHHANVDNAFRGWNDAWLDPRFRAFDIVEPLAYIRVPVLVVQGDRDPYGTLKQVEVLEEECYCPVETLILKDGGHAPHRERPAETLDAVAQFVDRVFRLHGEAQAVGRAA